MSCDSLPRDYLPDCQNNATNCLEIAHGICIVCSMSRYNSDSICQLGSIRQVLPVVRLYIFDSTGWILFNFPPLTTLITLSCLPCWIHSISLMFVCMCLDAHGLIRDLIRTCLLVMISLISRSWSYVLFLTQALLSNRTETILYLFSCLASEFPFYVCFLPKQKFLITIFGWKIKTGKTKFCSENGNTHKCRAIFFRYSLKLLWNVAHDNQAQ